MKSCIKRGYPLNVKQQVSSTNLLPRKRLITTMLSSRDDLRVICAPGLHGKTTLAHLYAEQTFDPDRVRWIDASDPSFLVSLDAITAESSLMDLPDEAATLSDVLLYIIDDCPKLEGDRCDVLIHLTDLLLERGHEVILTTRSPKWIRDKKGPHTIDAASILLDAEEQLAWADIERTNKNGTDADSLIPDLFRNAIPGIFCRGISQEEGITSILEEMSLETEEEAAALLAVVFGEGSTYELRSFAAALGDRSVADIERWYPFCGIKRFEPMFQAESLSDSRRFSLLCGHLPALCKCLSRFASEEALVEALVDTLIRRGQTLLAALLVCGAQDDKKREAFYDEFARRLIFMGKPGIVLRLSSSLKDSFLCQEFRWLSIVFAHMTLSQSVQAHARTRALFELSSALEDDLDDDRLRMNSLALSYFCHFDAEDEVRDLSELAHYSKKLGELMASVVKAAPTSPLCFEQELLELIWISLEDLSEGYEHLVRISSRGHSVKDSLTATCVFVQLVYRIADRHVSQGSKNALRENYYVSRTRELLGEVLPKLEETIAYVLVHSSEALPPNIAELFIFERAQQLFGEKAFIMIGDEVLSRVKSVKDELVTQLPQREMLKLSGARSPKQITPMRTTSASPIAKRIRINTFGRFEIKAYDPDVNIESKVRKQLRLLIALIAINNGQELSRAWVQQVMWPDAPEKNAKQNLYTMWSILNRSVTDQNGECPFFESFPHTIGINYDLVETDVDILGNLCKRLRSETLESKDYLVMIDKLEEIYLGELLPGENIAEVVAKRKVFQDQLIEALMVASDVLRKQGQTNLALRYIQFAFRVECTREDVCYLFMTLLWKLNRHAEALNVYYECQRALIDRLGIEGTVRLRELYEMILEDLA